MIDRLVIGLSQMALHGFLDCLQFMVQECLNQSHNIFVTRTAAFVDERRNQERESYTVAEALPLTGFAACFASSNGSPSGITSIKMNPIKGIIKPIINHPIKDRFFLAAINAVKIASTSQTIKDTSNMV